MPVPHSQDYHNCIVTVEIENVCPSVFKIVLALLGHFNFHVNFWISLSTSAKKVVLGGVSS